MHIITKAACKKNFKVALRYRQPNMSTNLCDQKPVLRSFGEVGESLSCKIRSIFPRIKCLAPPSRGWLGDGKVSLWAHAPQKHQSSSEEGADVNLGPQRKYWLTKQSNTRMQFDDFMDARNSTSWHQKGGCGFQNKLVLTRRCVPLHYFVDESML